MSKNSLIYLNHILECISKIKEYTTGLVEALTFFDKKEGVIVTLDQEDELQEDGKKIKLVPAYKWFG